MKSWIWLRALSVVLALFTLGHTLGTASPQIIHGPEELPVLAAMQGVKFPVQGFERSYWDFYRGFAISVSILFAVMTIIAWQLAALGRRNPREAMPLAVSMLLACIGLLVSGYAFFFAVPIVMSACATICAGVAVMLLSRESRGVKA